MKKEYLICSRHPDLRFKDENELCRHVWDEHESDVEDYLESFRDEAIERVAEHISKTIKLDPSEEEDRKPQEPIIDFEKIIREVAAGRQRTLGVSRQ